MEDLGKNGLKPVTLHYDNKVATHTDANRTRHERTKHFEFNCHLVREKKQFVIIEPRYIQSRTTVRLIYKGLRCSQISASN